MRIFLNIENLQADVVLKFKGLNNFVQIILQLAAYHCYVNNHKYPTIFTLSTYRCNSY